MEIPRGLTVINEVGEVAILREDCRKKDKPIMNQLAYVCKQKPFYMFEDLKSNNPTLRYGRIGKIHGYECFWFRISHMVNVLTDPQYNGKVERENSIKLFEEALENTSRFIKKKLSNEIKYLKKIIDEAESMNLV